MKQSRWNRILPGVAAALALFTGLDAADLEVPAEITGVVPEAGEFKLLYRYDLMSGTGFGDNSQVKYLTDNSSELSKNAVFARLAAALPRRRSGPCPEGTELGILKRECEKRARLKPVRLLLEQIPTLAPVLKPCFLMSPLSVAQYLPPDAEMFDLIIFILDHIVLNLERKSHVDIKLCVKALIITNRY